MREVIAQIDALSRRIRRSGQRWKIASGHEKRRALREAFEAAELRQLQLGKLNIIRSRLLGVLSACLSEIEYRAHISKERQIEALAKFGLRISRSVFGRTGLELDELRRLLTRQSRKYGLNEESPMKRILNQLSKPRRWSMAAVISAIESVERERAARKRKLASSSPTARAKLVKTILARPLSTHELDLELEEMRACLTEVLTACLQEIVRQRRRNDSQGIRQLTEIGATLSSSIFSPMGIDLEVLHKELAGWARRHKPLASSPLCNTLRSWNSDFSRLDSPR